MFVINANQNSQWYLNASLSGEYDTPLNWSTYNMFNHRSGVDTTNMSACASCWWITTGWTCNFASPQTTGWNGSCSNASSQLSYAKIEYLDNDVLFPYNRLCNWWGNQFERIWQLCYYLWCSTACGIMICSNVWCLCPIFTDVASRKSFAAWLNIGKTITGYMWICFWWSRWPTNTANQVRRYQACANTFYVDMWLLHTDWTRSSLMCCSYTFPYYSNCSTPAWWDTNINGAKYILNWVKTTNWLVTQEWDRLYVRYWACWKWKIYRCVINWWCMNSRMSCFSYEWRLFVWTWDRFLHSCCSWTNLTECNTDSINRFNWIQFSIN